MSTTGAVAHSPNSKPAGRSVGSARARPGVDSKPGGGGGVPGRAANSPRLMWTPVPGTWASSVNSVMVVCSQTHARSPGADDGGPTIAAAAAEVVRAGGVAVG